MFTAFCKSRSKTAAAVATTATAKETIMPSIVGPAISSPPAAKPMKINAIPIKAIRLRQANFIFFSVLDCQPGDILEYKNK